MRLECHECAVRDWAPSDAQALVRLADNRAIWRNMTDRFPHPYRASDAQAWFALLAGADEPTHWAIEVDGELAGGIGIQIGDDVFSRCAELGYWLGEPFWGDGVMSAAVRMVAPWAMSRFGLCRLEAGVFAWNPASMRVLEKCGFAREGVAEASIFKDGTVTDRVVYALVDRTAG